MTTVDKVEKKIFEVEGFKIAFLDRVSKQNVRGDLGGIPPYIYKKASAKDNNVQEWISTRFYSKYPGFEVKVLLGNGEEAHGNTRLQKVRDTYKV